MDFQKGVGSRNSRNILMLPSSIFSAIMLFSAYVTSGYIVYKTVPTIKHGDVSNHILVA